MRWASAISDNSDLERAIDEITTATIAELAGESPHLAISFVSQHFTARYPDCLRLLRAALPDTLMLGCSAGGVIGGGREIEQKPAISLTVAHLPDVELRPLQLEAGDLPDADASPRAWLEALGVPREPIPQFILIADPFSFPVPQLLAGLDYSYPASVKVGGLASGARQPGGNALYLNDTVASSGLVGVAMSGNVDVRTIVAQGCRPVGEACRITRAEGHVLFELDDKPALARMQEIIASLNETDKLLAQDSLHLGVVISPMVADPLPGDFLIRNFAGIDPNTGAVAIGESLRDGQLVQLHVRDAKTSSEDLDLLLDRLLRDATAEQARGALLFSCLGRGVHLYGRPDHDTQRFQAKLGMIPLGGFFCNGEIGPVSGSTHLHGFTSSFGIFGPVAAPETDAAGQDGEAE